MLISKLWFILVLYGIKTWVTALTAPNRRGYRFQQPEAKEGAYEIAAAAEIKVPCIILVNPFLDQNVGSVSRAMLNFGLHELRVVDPRCDILSEQARALAVGSVAILENAKIFPTVAEAVADLQRIFATTVRPRHMTQVILTPSAAAEVAISTTSNTIKSGILFGRERSGLTNEEVALADSIISIPSFRHFSSLNLAQAVNIVGFELWKRNMELSSQSPPEKWLAPVNPGERLARREELDFFLGRLISALDEKNYQFNPDVREINYRNIRNVFQRTLMTRQEVDLFHGVLSVLIREKRIEVDGRWVLPDNNNEEHVKVTEIIEAVDSMGDHLS